MNGRARLGVAAAVAAVVSAMPAVGPASAQSRDVPELGLELDPGEGSVGTRVTVQVDRDDIAAHCITDPTDWVGQFVDPLDPAGDPTPYQETLQARAAQALQERDPEHEGVDGDFLDTFVEVAEKAGEDPELFILGLAGLYPVGLALELPEDPDGVVDAAVSSWFVAAFVDRSGDAIEPVAGFDAADGIAEVEVPRLAPGQHHVIASCAALSDDVTDADIDEALAVGTAFVEANLSTPLPSDPFGPGKDDYAQAAAEVLPVFLQELLDPRAFGVEVFTVPGGEPPPSSSSSTTTTSTSTTTTSTTTTTVPGQPNGTAPPKAPPARPVAADPNFVG